MKERGERATKECIRMMRQAQLAVQVLLTWTSDRNKSKYRGQVRCAGRGGEMIYKAKRNKDKGEPF